MSSLQRKDAFPESVKAWHPCSWVSRIRHELSLLVIRLVIRMWERARPSLIAIAPAFGVTWKVHDIHQNSHRFFQAAGPDKVCHILSLRRLTRFGPSSVVNLKTPNFVRKQLIIRVRCDRLSNDASVRNKHSSSADEIFLTMINFTKQALRHNLSC